MAKKLVGVLIDLEYPDADAGASENTNSMLKEVIRIIEAGAAANSFNVTHIPSSVTGFVDSMFELDLQ
jgi:hypothetical protein